MTVRLWKEEWFRSVGGAQRDLGRGVEAQHQMTTMRLADDLREQELLEQLLEGGKPPLPPEASAAHYLLSARP